MKGFRPFLHTVLIVGALLGLFGGQAGALTLSEIRTQIRLHTKDVGTSSTRQTYSDSQLNTLINEAQRDVINASWAIQKQTTVELVSGTTYYDLPTDVMEITRVTWLDRNLKETTFQEEDAAASNSAWERTGGAPDSYFQDPSQPDKIGFQPYPNSATSTGTVKIFYIAYASDLSSDSDVPFNALDRMVPYHDLLIFYPCFKIFLIQGNQVKFQTYAQWYESRLLSFRDKYGTKPNYNPGFGGNRGP